MADNRDLARIIDASNKKLGRIHDLLCCKFGELIALTETESDETQELLTEMRDLLTQLNTLGSSCDTPIYTNSCESYNNVTQYEVLPGNPLTIPANSIHSISYKIIDGDAQISIGGTALLYSIGEMDFEEASTLIAQEYVFTAVEGGRIKVKTIH